jgi:hypothetical protein
MKLDTSSFMDVTSDVHMQFKNKRHKCGLRFILPAFFLASFFFVAKKKLGEDGCSCGGA